MGSTATFTCLVFYLVLHYISYQRILYLVAVTASFMKSLNMKALYLKTFNANATLATKHFNESKDANRVKNYSVMGLIVLSTKQNAILLLKEVLSKFRYTAWVSHMLHASFLTGVIYLYQIISMMEII